ncbi:MAG: glycosyltransferase family 1 protein [Deltaproteobacteria bacterium]|nr:glycosyltransferase family 1 protein [Deltaproteobacteria bacterium]
MRIAVACIDTRGGVQPYVGLALGLRRAGHDVRAVAPSDLAPLFEGVNIPVRALSGSIEEALRASGGAAERGRLATIRLMSRELPSRLRTWTKEALEACEGVDVVTGGVGGMVLALSVAEKLGAPFVEAHLQPVGAPTDAYPGVLLPGTPPWLGRAALRLSHHLSERILWLPFKGQMAKTREEVLGLHGPPRAAQGQPVLYGFSRHVVPLPEGGERPRHVTGYWMLPAPPTFRPPPALEAFLAGGRPVVSVGFGSMSSRDPQRLTALALGAARLAKVRVVLLSGWGGLKTLENDDVFCADALPHDWLFPRVAAAVHHGGAGTTGAALRAGVPAIVVPFTMDQPFWASRVAALGAGPAPISRRWLTEASLAAALRTAVCDEAMRKRAAELSEKIRSEDGPAAAAECFGRLAASLGKT